MADLWYYTNEGRQLEPVSEAELKQLAASGSLKPTDLVWKEGMPQWIRASAARELFPDARLSRAESHGEGRGPRDAASAREADPDAVEERPRRRRRPRDDDDDYDDERPRRRRPQGMSTEAKIAIIGGSIGAVLLVAVIVVIGVALSNDRPVPKPAPVVMRPAQPPFVRQAPRPRFAQAAPLNLPGIVHLKEQDQLTFDDPIDMARQFQCRCKTYIVNMTAGVQYTIVLESQHFDAYLRLEDEKGIMLAENDDGFPGRLDSRIDFVPPRTGSYRVVATSLVPRTGAFTLTVLR